MRHLTASRGPNGQKLKEFDSEPSSRGSMSKFLQKVKECVPERQNFDPFLSFLGLFVPGLGKFAYLENMGGSRAATGLSKYSGYCTEDVIVEETPGRPLPYYLK